MSGSVVADGDLLDKRALIRSHCPPPSACASLHAYFAQLKRLTCDCRLFIVCLHLVSDPREQVLQKLAISVWMRLLTTCSEEKNMRN